MAHRLAEKVVVITGASSGIGKATADAFAAEGATVVLAARREQGLHETAELVIRDGGKAMAVPTDVRDADQMRHLADRAIDAFGGIDIWVNNAGIASFGKFEQTPPEVFTNVVNSTFYGVVNGFRAVLPHFREQGRGTIITTASIAGRVPTPYQSAYVAAKHAVLGFVEAVRQELHLDGLDDIHVCSVLPGPIDTPFWQHAANYTGRDVQALEPATPPDKVASAILGLVFRPRREVGVGIPPWVLEMGMALAQGPMERRMARMTQQTLFQDSTRPATDGAVMRPMPEGTGERGGWIERQHRGNGGHAAGIGTAGLLALAVPLGAAAWYRYQKHGRVL